MREGRVRRTLMRVAEEGKGFSASTIWCRRSNDVVPMIVEWRDERGRIGGDIDAPLSESRIGVRQGPCLM
jgi:hypothetical protein